MESNSEAKKKWYQSMVGIIALLILFFPVGLYLMWKYSGWNKIAMVAITGFFGLMLLGSMASGGTKTSTTTSQPTQATQQAVQLTQASKPTFDIPSLIGKNIDEVRVILGEPLDSSKEPTQQQISLGAKEWDNNYKKDNKDLLITYNVSSRKVVDFFIGSDDPSGITTDKVHLLQLGNLRENDPKYTVEFVKTLKDPSSFTGVKAIPTITTKQQVQPTKVPVNATTAPQAKSAPASNGTVSQKNAVSKAKSYLNFTGFSHDGLVAQLEYEQFSNADAVYGSDNSGANWNEQAAKKAKSYMEFSAFSRGSLIDQLKYDKFTQEQAEYGANAVGL